MIYYKFSNGEIALSKDEAIDKEIDLRERPEEVEILDELLLDVPENQLEEYIKDLNREIEILENDPLNSHSFVWIVANMTCLDEEQKRLLYMAKWFCTEDVLEGLKQLSASVPKCSTCDTIIKKVLSSLEKREKYKIWYKSHLYAVKETEDWEECALSMGEPDAEILAETFSNSLEKIYHLFKIHQLDKMGLI